MANESDGKFPTGTDGSDDDDSWSTVTISAFHPRLEQMFHATPGIVKRKEKDSKGALIDNSAVEVEDAIKEEIPSQPSQDPNMIKNNAHFLMHPRIAQMLGDNQHTSTGSGSDTSHRFTGQCGREQGSDAKSVSSGGSVEDMKDAI